MVVQHIHTEKFKNSNSGVSENNSLNYSYNVFKQLIPSIKLKFVSPKETEDVVSSLKMKDSHGFDGIYTKILKLSIPYISSPLTYICNLMALTSPTGGGRSVGIVRSRIKATEFFYVT
jgi:hypothetical protein